MIHDSQFLAMGSTCRIVVNAGSGEELATWAIARVAELEQRWSRFLPTSEISEMNRAGGAAMDVSTDTATLLTLAKLAWTETDGLFDPTMLIDLEGQGYDRTHTDLPAPTDENGQLSSVPERTRRSSCGDIAVSNRTVQLPAGIEFDPGGIGKGLAADIVAEELIQHGAVGAMVELGGDVRVIGDHPDHGPVWTVSVDDPGNPGSALFSLGLADGGIATSSQQIRRWSTPAGDRHHLLDSSTGQPSHSPVAAAVVTSGSAAWAEVAAKASLLAGFENGSTLIAGSGCSGAMFGFDGSSHDVGLMAAATQIS